MSKVSFIVPIYKVEEYINKCVDSIINQTYRNLEIILVDDGSTDNCPAICDEYASKDSRIVVIHRKNGGLSAARNTGIAAAKGEYVCVVDSDDIVHPQYCEFLLNALRETNADFCACAVKRFPDGQAQEFSSYDSNSIVKQVSYHDFLHNQLTGKIEICVWNRIYKREIFERVLFQEGKLHEDIFFAADLFTIPNLRCAFIENELYFYRQRDNGIVGQQNTSKRLSPDRVLAGSYLLSNAKTNGFKYIDDCLKYAINYPWTFIDLIYLNRDFTNNKQFLQIFQDTLRDNKQLIKKSRYFSKTIKHRMRLISLSRLLYSFNILGRLFFTYFLRIIHLDPYKSKHCI